MILGRGVSKAAVSAFALVATALALSSCSTMSEPRHKAYHFPKSAFIGKPPGREPGRDYEEIGAVRSKVDFASLNFDSEESQLCRNYFNKSVAELVKYGKDQGADAVIDIQSVVFLEDGRRETYPKAECSDDGAEGQVLTQGVAVKWRKPGDPPFVPKPAPSPSASSSAAPVSGAGNGGALPPTPRKSRARKEVEVPQPEPDPEAGASFNVNDPRAGILRKKRSSGD